MIYKFSVYQWLKISKSAARNAYISVISKHFCTAGFSSKAVWQYILGNVAVQLYCPVATHS